MSDVKEYVLKKIIHKACGFILIYTASSAPLFAMESQYGENNEGKIYVSGVLAEGACRLDMESLYQEVRLENISPGRLQKPGSTGEPATFRIRFSECLRHNGGRQRNPETGVYTWDALQPVVSVTFIAVTDPLKPSLLSVTGVSGLALAIHDSRGEQVVPGIAGSSSILMPENDELVYTVTPVRTEKKMTAGKFQAVANFQVNYE